MVFFLKLTTVAVIENARKNKNNMDETSKLSPLGSIQIITPKTLRTIPIIDRAFMNFYSILTAISVYCK